MVLKTFQSQNMQFYCGHKLYVPVNMATTPCMLVIYWSSQQPGAMELTKYVKPLPDAACCHQLHCHNWPAGEVCDQCFMLRGVLLRCKELGCLLSAKLAHAQVAAGWKYSTVAQQCHCGTQTFMIHRKGLASTSGAWYADWQCQTGWVHWCLPIPA